MTDRERTVEALAVARATATLWMNRAQELRTLLALTDTVIDAARSGGGPRMIQALREYDAAKAKVR